MTRVYSFFGHRIAPPPNSTFWLRDAGIVTSAGVATSWNNLGSTGLTVAGGGGSTNPTTASIDSRLCVKADGVDDFMHASSLAANTIPHYSGIGSLYDAYTIGIVFRPDVTSSVAPSQAGWNKNAIFTDETNGDWWPLVLDASGSAGGHYNGTDSATVTSIPLVTGTVYYTEITYDGTTFSFKMDGITRTKTISSMTLGAGKVRLFSSYDNTKWTGATVCEILAYPSTLNSNDLALLQKYMQQQFPSARDATSKDIKTPNSVSGLTLWERSPNISGSPVDAWPNDALASGGGTFTQTGGNRPSVTTVNSISSPLFARASSQSLVGATAISSYITSTAYEGFLVVNITSLGSGNDSTDSTPYARPAVWAATTGGRMGVSVSASGVKTFIFNGSVYQNTGFVSIPVGTPQLIGFRLSGGTLFLSVGATEVSTSVGSIDLLTMVSRIGSNFDGSAFLDGAIGEMVVYNRVLSTTERTGIRAYLRQRFGCPT